MLNLLFRRHRLRVGDRVELAGGYETEPAWLAGRAGYTGVLERFIPGQNQAPAAVVRLDETVSFGGVEARIAVLELRYVGASWRDAETVHVELCDFEPEDKAWPNRRQGVWAESHATIRYLRGLPT